MAAIEGGLEEQIGWNSEPGAQWRFAGATGTSVSGTWHDGSRRLPVRLQRAEWTPGEIWPQACASAAFVGPHLDGGDWQDEQSEFAGYGYTLRTFRAPPQLIEQDSGYPLVEIVAFLIPETQPGDAAINAALAQYELPDDFTDCFAGMIAQRGLDGFWSLYAQPEVITPRWLGFRTSNENDCGGVHPNHWQDRRVFDRQSGSQVDATRWLGHAGTVRDPQAEAGTAYPQTSLTPALLELAIAHWPEASGNEVDLQDCFEIVREGRGWNVGLAPDGLAFMPDLPHVGQVCAETLVVPWHELAPYLSDEGRVVAATFGVG